LPEDHKTRERAGAVSPVAITKRILDEKPGLAKSQPKIELADSIDKSLMRFLDETAFRAPRGRNAQD
jgi:hypothetical protein